MQRFFPRLRHSERAYAQSCGWAKKFKLDSDPKPGPRELIGLVAVCFLRRIEPHHLLISGPIITPG